MRKITTESQKHGEKPIKNLRDAVSQWFALFGDTFEKAC